MTDFDFSTLSMTEIIRQQNLLQQELTRRFERRMTLVFSDIVGSTPYFARFGDAAGFQLQQRHMDLLNSCLPAREGRIVDTAGDGAFVAFPTADAATNALIEFQQLISRENATRARDHQLQVRIGVHCGPLLTDGEVFSGDAVNLCARVASSASPGEIRLTREVFQDLALTHRLNCRPLGPVDLKGLSRQIELLNLDWRDHSMFPTLFRIEETGEEVLLPQQDIISFGRLREHEGTLANDVVLTLPDPLQARQISRWHFELRRLADGFRLRPLADGATEVDGAPITKGQEVVIKPGSKVCVAHVLTLAFASPSMGGEAENSDATMIAGKPRPERFARLVDNDAVHRDLPSLAGRAAACKPVPLERHGPWPANSRCRPSVALPRIGAYVHPSPSGRRVGMREDFCRRKRDGA